MTGKRQSLEANTEMAWMLASASEQTRMFPQQFTREPMKAYRDSAREGKIEKVNQTEI